MIPDLTFIQANGYVLRNGSRIELEQVRLGELVVVSNRILVGDAAGLGEALPFEEQVPNGNHPVFLTRRKDLTFPLKELAQNNHANLASGLRWGQPATA